MLRPLYACDTDDMRTPTNAPMKSCMVTTSSTAPMLEEGLTSPLSLPPKGTCHYFTNEITEGAKEHMVDVPLDGAPIFIREGAVIPHFPPMNYVGEKKIDTIDLFIYYKHGEESSFLYEDGVMVTATNKGHSLQRTFFSQRHINQPPPHSDHQRLVL